MWNHKLGVFNVRGMGLISNYGGWPIANSNTFNWYMLLWYSAIVVKRVYQWPFQEPKLEVPTIYKAYVRAKFQGISPQHMACKMVLTYLHFRVLKIPLSKYQP